MEVKLEQGFTGAGGGIISRTRLHALTLFALLGGVLLALLWQGWLTDLTFALGVLLFWFPACKSQLLRRVLAGLIFLSFAAALTVQFWSMAWAESFLRTALWLFLLVALAALGCGSSLRSRLPRK